MPCGHITQLAKASVTAGKNVFEDKAVNLSGAGTFCKVIGLVKNDFVIKHKHDYDHLSILLSGMVIVKTDDNEYVMDATVSPKSTVIKANEYHAVYALTDASWLCVHKESI